jgi:outer membrane immunogenic protein
VKKLFALSAAIAALGWAGSAYAADMPVKAPPLMPAPAYTWTGWYVGGNLGYGWGAGSNPSQSFIDTSGGGLTAYIAGGGIVPAAADPKGVIGGAQIGYNWQTNNFVFGLVTDFDGSGMTATTTNVTPTNGINGTTTLSRKMDWLGTLRARAGVAQQNWLWYVSGGLAYGHIQENLTFASTAAAQATGSHSRTRAGWTAGTGFEYGWSRWTAGLEYLYVDLGRSSVTETFSGYAGAAGDSVTMSSRNTAHIVRAILNYRF